PARLLIRSGLGRLGAGVEAELHEIMASASPRWLTALVCAARRDPVLDRALSDSDLRFLRDLGQWYVDGGQPQGAALIHEVQRLRPGLRTE
ncbi:hypothetical protein GTY54_39130, partial [Streptomyces sp. SID625]|nr:hypothetical protein [Streptomyces sp. SID625]